MSEIDFKDLKPLKVDKEKGKFRWLEVGNGEEPVILLHGLMGGVENFGEMVDYISTKYKVYGLDLKLFEGRNLLKELSPHQLTCKRVRLILQIKN